MAGERQDDTTFTDPSERFKVQLYFATVDIVSQQMKDRFADFLGTVLKFSFLEPRHFMDEDSTGNI